MGPTQTTGTATPAETTQTPPQTETTEAPQIVRIAEAELPTATAAQVAEIRVIDTQGNSKTMTLAEARKALAITPSLTEQLVPGEFWIGADGISRQVYQKTVRGTLVADLVPDLVSALLANGIRSASIIQLSVRDSSNYDRSGKYAFTNVSLVNQLWLQISAANYAGSRFSITIKYTKI